MLIKNGRDEIDKNGVFKIIEHFQIWDIRNQYTSLLHRIQNTPWFSQYT